jgi:hypothetical protein
MDGGLRIGLYLGVFVWDIAATLMVCTLPAAVIPKKASKTEAKFVPHNNKQTNKQTNKQPTYRSGRSKQCGRSGYRRMALYRTRCLPANGPHDNHVANGVPASGTSPQKRLNQVSFCSYPTRFNHT